MFFTILFYTILLLAVIIGSYTIIEIWSQDKRAKERKEFRQFMRDERAAAYKKICERKAKSNGY